MKLNLILFQCGHAEGIPVADEADLADEFMVYHSEIGENEQESEESRSTNQQTATEGSLPIQTMTNDNFGN